MYLLPMFIEIMCEAEFPRFFFGSFIAAETLRDVEQKWVRVTGEEEKQKPGAYPPAKTDIFTT